jgi:oligoribonuclease (3'-5' exoribonuclease)
MSFSRKGREYILWVDLETIGQTKNFGEDHILEIGCSITDQQMNEIDSRQYVLPISSEMVDKMPLTVLTMHTVNGLIEDAKKVGIPDNVENLWIARAMLLSNIDRELTAWVKSYVGSNHIPFAGSGTSHFDRKYIDRDLPLFSRRLSYWNLDIGVVRRFLELAGIQLTVGPNGAGEKNHRALDDARLHSREAKRFIEWAKWK